MINTSTLSFLTELAANNERDWFQANKPRFETAKANAIEFTTALIDGISKFDPLVPADLEAKDCLMRIYRDVRFSLDKTPYKNNFGIGISPNGKNFNGPGYYMHIEPGNCFVAGGSWMPSPEHLKAFRQEIDYNGSELLEAIGSDSFKKIFGDLSSEGSLKTTPKGYAADHPMMKYLKLKSYVADAKISDKQLTGSDSLKNILDMFETLYPLMSFLRNGIA